MTYPGRGQSLPDFSLMSTDGERAQLSDFRNRRNIVLILAGASGDELLDAIGRDHRKFLQEETEVIAVLRPNRGEAQALKQRKGWEFLVLVDPDGTVHCRLGGERSLAVYVADRFGEIFWACRTVEGHTRPTAKEILEWLQFINIQCPECFPSEWPA
jgi:peroxiredoxin